MIKTGETFIGIENFILRKWQNQLNLMRRYRVDLKNEKDEGKSILIHF